MQTSRGGYILIYYYPTKLSKIPLDDSLLKTLMTVNIVFYVDVLIYTKLNRNFKTVTDGDHQQLEF